MFDIDENQVRMELIQLASAVALPRILQHAAHIGLGHLLEESPRSLEEIASHFGYDQAVLRDVLAVLVNCEIVGFEDGRYQSTLYSENLDIINQLFLGRENWACWGALDRALASGSPVFESIYGQDFFSYLADRPDENRKWKDWNSATATQWLTEVTANVDIEGTATVCDIGGGEGALVQHLVNDKPDLRATVLDRPEVRPRATPGFDWVAGDMFEVIPEGFDVYLLSRVCCNWSDDDLVVLFGNVRQAMRNDSVLHIIDGFVEEGGEEERGVLAANSLSLFLMFGSRIRTLSEMESLLTRSGFDLSECRRLHSVADSNWHTLTARPIQTS